MASSDTNAIAEIQKKIADATLSPPGAEAVKQTETPQMPPNNEETKVEESSGAVPQQPVATPQQPQALQTQAQAPAKVDVYTTQPQQVQEDNKEPEQDRTNLIINYLPPTMSEGTLATLFSPYGLLERCKIVVDLQTLRSRGYGFVKYDNSSSAERALKALNGYELNGKKLKVAFARQQCKAITNANLYITNIPPHYENDNLRKLFRDYGTIVECRVLKDQHGQSRGVGFVRMDTHHNAIQALQAMDQYVIDDKHPPLLVKLAQRRVPRRYWNTQNRNQNNQGGRGPKPQGAGGMNNGRGKKRNSPNRRYAPKGAYRQQQGQMGQGMGAMDYAGGAPANGGQYGGGGNYNRGSPNKRGYYRPRQYKQQKPQYQPRRQPNQAAQPYFAAAPTAMYAAEPYGMPQYAQPAYAQNIHMTAAAAISNPPPNPANPAAGPKRNKSPTDWQQ